MIKDDTGFETNDVKHTGWSIEKEQYVIHRVYMGVSDEDSQKGKQFGLRDHQTSSQRLAQI
jgi:hypothetical protein